MSVGPVMLFILQSISANSTLLSELARLSVSGGRIEQGQGARKPWSDQRLVCWETTNSMGDLLPEVARRSVPKREHGKGNKHDDNLYASSGTSQSNHLPSVFMSNTLNSSSLGRISITYSSVSRYTWVSSVPNCITGYLTIINAFISCWSVKKW